MKKALLALLALIFVGSGFAQLMAPLTIDCNEPNADVFVNGKLKGRTGRNLLIPLPTGSYSVRVTKAGFEDYDNPRVAVKSGVGATLRVVLNPSRPAAAAPLPPAPIEPVPAPVKPVPEPPRTASPPLVQQEPPRPATSFEGAGDQSRPATSRDRKRGSGNTTVPSAPLALRVNSNVQGAQVFINGEYAGQTPLDLSVARGLYEVRVSAPGYQDSFQRANVRSSMQLQALLQSALAPLTVTSNVQGAEVLIDGAAAGRTPLSTALTWGPHAIVVRAPGFFDYKADLSIAGPQTVSATLQAALSTWRLVGLAPAGRRGGRTTIESEASELRLWVDGAPNIDFAGQVAAGRHVFRLMIGGMTAETQVDMQAGRDYVFEPFLGMNIK
jgi:hypothetical protein